MKKILTLLLLPLTLVALIAAMPSTQAERLFNSYQECSTGVSCVQVTGSPGRWSGFQEAITALTQVQAAPATGLRNYVTGIALSNEAATVQTVDIVTGTGTNCGTNTAALSHKFQLGTNATTTSPFVVTVTFRDPLVPPAGAAICVRPANATAFGATLSGYTAP